MKPYQSLIVGFIFLAMCSRRHAEIVEIPGNYKGWVEIIYSATCAPSTETSDGSRVLRVDINGRLCSGSPWQEGSARDTFFYVDGARRVFLREETPGVGMIWGRSTRQVDRGKERVERFFVGTEAEYRHATSTK
jgi:hypothetical protein